MLRALAAAAILLGAASCASDPPPLDEFIRFSDARSCVPAADFQQLLDSLLVARQADGKETYVLGKLEMTTPFADRVGAPRLETPEKDLYVATATVRGTWQGLTVREVYTYRKPETDYQGLGIRFAATPAQVRVAANRAGFELPETGRRTDSSELDLTIEVAADPAGAVLRCGT